MANDNILTYQGPPDEQGKRARVSFYWSSKTPPTDEQLDEIFTQKHQSDQQKIQEAGKAAEQAQLHRYFPKARESHPNEGPVGTALEGVGSIFTWPFETAKQLYDTYTEPQTLPKMNPLEAWKGIIREPKKQLVNDIMSQIPVVGQVMDIAAPEDTEHKYPRIYAAGQLAGMYMLPKMMSGARVAERTPETGEGKLDLSSLHNDDLQALHKIKPSAETATELQKRGLIQSEALTEVSPKIEDVQPVASHQVTPIYTPEYVAKMKAQDLGEVKPISSHSVWDLPGEEQDNVINSYMNQFSPEERGRLATTLSRGDILNKIDEESGKSPSTASVNQATAIQPTTTPQDEISQNPYTSFSNEDLQTIHGLEPNENSLAEMKRRGLIEEQEPQGEPTQNLENIRNPENKLEEGLSNVDLLPKTRTAMLEDITPAEINAGLEQAQKGIETTEKPSDQFEKAREVIKPGKELEDITEPVDPQFQKNLTNFTDSYLRDMSNRYEDQGQTSYVQAIDDEINRRAGHKITKVPPGTAEGSESDTQFLIDRVKKRSDRILQRLKEEESGTFSPANLIDFFKGSKQDVTNDVKAMNDLKAKRITSEELSPAEKAQIEDWKKIYGFDPTTVMKEPNFLGKLSDMLFSTDQQLSKNPHTKPIADTITNAEIDKRMWRIRSNDALNNIRKETSGVSPKKLFDLMNGTVEPTTVEEVKARAALRSYLDGIYQELVRSGATNASGKLPNYLKDYITHMEQSVSFSQPLLNALQRIFAGDSDEPTFKEYLQSKGRFFRSEQKGLTGDTNSGLYNKGVGTPQDPYLETRTGQISNLETNVWKVLQRYSDAAARVMYDKPAIQEVQDMIAKLPDGHSKSLATWYANNYIGFDSNGELTRLAKLIDRRLLGASGARSVLWGNTRLQVLHLWRIWTQVWPEVGSKYLLQGMADIIKNPKEAYKLTRDYGLLPQSERSLGSQLAQKDIGTLVDRVGNFLDAGNTFAKMVSLRANIAKAIDEGLDPKDPNVRNNIIREVGRQEGMTSKATDIYALERAPRSLVQFKFWLAKYIENVKNATGAAIENPSPETLAKVSRYAFSILSSLYLTKELGLTLWHANLRTLEIASSTVSSAAERVLSDFAKGDYAKGLETIALFFTLGGQSIKREFEQPTFYEERPTHSRKMTFEQKERLHERQREKREEKLMR